MKHHSDPSRPMREHDAAESAKREPRPAPDPAARREHLDYEREQLRRNRLVDAQLDHALVESFPASDPLAVTPEGTFPVRDPQLADPQLADPQTADAGKPDAPRHGGQGPRHAQRRGDPQTPPQPVDPTPAEPLPPQLPAEGHAAQPGNEPDHAARRRPAPAR